MNTKNAIKYFKAQKTVLEGQLKKINYIPALRREYQHDIDIQQMCIERMEKKLLTLKMKE